MGTRLAVTMAQSGVAVNSQGTDCTVIGRPTVCHGLGHAALHTVVPSDY